MASLLPSSSTFLRRLEVPYPEDQPRPTWLINNDIRPIERGRRIWGWHAYFAFWGIMAFNMSNFQVGSSLLAVGLIWWQALLATLVGHILAAALVIAASYPGLEYHIAFPVAMRVGWGFYGAIFVVLNRIVLTVIWCGLSSWQGGLMAYVCLRAIWPSVDNIPNTIPASTGMTLPQFVGFVVYFVVQFPLLFLGPGPIRVLLYVGSIGGFLVQLVLVAWACGTMGPEGFGDVLDNKSQLPSQQLGWMFMYGVSVTMSAIIAAVLGICDYARFARSRPAGTWSQAFGAAPAWISNIFGMLTIAATQRRYGSQLWSISSLLTAVQNANPDSRTRVAVFFCGLFFAISQLALNVSGNSFTGGTDMSTLLPKYINIRRGQILTALIGLVINPWYLFASAVIFVSVMSSYTIFLQPFVGTLVAHYFIVHRRRIKVSDLYVVGRPSLYWYRAGVNWRAVLAWVIGVAPHIAGFLHNVKPSIQVSAGASQTYYLSSITGFVISFAVTILLDYIAPVEQQKAFVCSVSKQEAHDLVEETTEITCVSMKESLQEEVRREQFIKATREEIMYSKPPI